MGRGRRRSRRRRRRRRSEKKNNLLNHSFNRSENVIRRGKCTNV